MNPFPAGAQKSTPSDPGDPAYAAYYNSLAPSTRAFMHAPGSPGLARANAAEATDNARLAREGITDPFGDALRGLGSPSRAAQPAGSTPSAVSDPYVAYTPTDPVQLPSGPSRGVPALASTPTDPVSLPSGTAQGITTLPYDMGAGRLSSLNTSTAGAAGSDAADDFLANRAAVLPTQAPQVQQPSAAATFTPTPIFAPGQTPTASGNPVVNALMKRYDRRYW